MKKIVVLFLLFVVVSLYALNAYFFEDRFNVDDAAPLSDPHTSTGGQSVDVFEVDGSLAIAGGKLTVTAQATPVDGDLGMIHETSKTSYIGAGAFFKMVPKTLGLATSGSFGFSDAVDNVDVGNAGFQSILMSVATFDIGFNEQVADVVAMITAPTVNDTFYLAYINGGSDDDAGPTGANPWFSGGGLSLDDWSEGNFIFIKKGTGKWILNAINPTCSRAAMYPNISSFNSTYELYDWVTLGDGDSAYTPYMQPLHYQSCAPTSGQLFDDTPEVGAAYDSVQNNFVFVAGSAVQGEGADAGAPLQWFSTANLGDDDVYGMILTNPDDNTTSRGAAVALRYNSVTDENIIANVSTSTNAFAIFTCDGATYTSRASAAVTMINGTTFNFTIIASVLDSTVTAWYLENGGAYERLQYTGTTVTTGYGDNSNSHGIRVPDIVTQIKYIRFYPIGNDNEFSGLTNFFTRGGNRGQTILIQ